MNLILLEPAETAKPLPLADPRAIHILDVLRRKIGDSIDVGLVDGPRGKATLTATTADALTLAFTWGELPPPLPPLTLLIGLPRPQTARKILQEAATLGVGALHFVTTERGEPSYASSTLWTSGEWQRHLRDGVAQAFCTRLPAVTFGQNPRDLLPNLPPNAMRIALDNYEATASLLSALASMARPGPALLALRPVVLAFGAERGWTSAERTLLRENQFTLAHLGPRVLRTETACVATIAIVKSALGWL